MRRQTIDIPPCEQMAIENAKREMNKVYFITSRFKAEKYGEKYSCMEEEPCVGNEELVFTLTPVQEALLKGIVNYESIEDMDKNDLTAIVIINQGSLMEFPEVEGIGYEGTYILLEGKKKDSYMDEEEVCKTLKRNRVVRAGRKKKEKNELDKMTK